MTSNFNTWFKDMFINEAKAVLDSRNNMLGSGGNTGGGSSSDAEIYDGSVIVSGEGWIGGNDGWIGDGNTHIWITLHEGRTSPLLGVCPNGTVTVDWGDGTTPDVLTGTSTSNAKYTPNHEYAKAGDYVITLTVDGEMGFSSPNFSSFLLQKSRSGGNDSRVYANAVQKVEIGESVTSIGKYAFSGCYSLASITISDGVTSVGDYAFTDCHSLASITIPAGVTSIGNSAFNNCHFLASITIPAGVTSIGNSVFNNCYSLASITIPDSVTSIGTFVFNNCYSLASITIPDSVTSIGTYVFYNCYSLASITIPDSITSISEFAFATCKSLASIIMPAGVTSIGNSAFYGCCSLASITIPDGVTSIDTYTFSNCYGIRYYDFSKHTAVPTLSNTNAFTSIPSDCEIRVPAALYDEWIAATNWTTYASYIKAV